MIDRRAFLGRTTAGAGWLLAEGSRVGGGGGATVAVARVHHYQNAEVGLLNAYLVETPESLVAIDTGFLVDDVDALSGWIQRLRKPLRRILVTHPHPDHYNGARLLSDRTGARVACTEEVARVIRRRDAEEVLRYGSGFGDRYPPRRALPDIDIVSHADVVEVDGVAIHVEDLGPGESDSDTLFWLESEGVRHVFPGDVVMGGTHAFFRDGHTGSWLETLEWLAGEIPGGAVIHPGHGDPGGVDLVAAQGAYVRTAREAVAQELEDRTFGPEARDRIQAKVGRLRPAEKLGFLVPFGVDILAAELGLEAARAGLTNLLRGGAPFVGARSAYIDVLGSRMHYVEQGEGMPILLLHGQPTSSYLWRRIIPGLSKIGHVIALDLIGFGRSERPEIDYDVADHARYVAAFIEGLGLSDLTIVGHDWGSYLGAQYAVDHRDRVKGLVFMEAILAGGGRLAAPEGEGLLVGRAAAAIELIVRAARAEPAELQRIIGEENAFVERFLPMATMRQLTEDEMEAYRAPFRDPDTRNPMAQWPRQVASAAAGREIERYSAALEEWDVPKLMLTVEPGVLMPETVVTWARERFSRLNVTHLGLGLHFVQEDYPEEIAAAIASWAASEGLIEDLG